jgi:hypothetical protein
MRLANMATGPKHEARENNGQLYVSTSVVEHDEEAADERWCDDVNEDIICLLQAGENESSTAQRRTHPGYSKLETTTSQKLDWRAASIVSPYPNTLYLY